ncbi:hypothetical protein [Winogradskyella thalassocola]|uniref:Uncharacterized protein n=1 Tax=Winogradskyella thalassocola TaxID=262004 RepID=A0A1G8B926_9FLAO|nr:hypothetical protein [Winogradskyella thalassocola]SDH29695.1 hypothetical protein SAMN04489796_102187 [Winogradskyella thalassocola]
MGQSIKLLYDIFKINSQPFYENLLRLDFAIWVFIITGIVSLLFVVLYYYVVDRPKTAKLTIWLLFLLVVSIVSSIIAYMVANDSIIDNYLSQGLSVLDEIPYFFQDLIYFSLTNFLFGALFFLIWSSLLKWKSSNSSHIPF